MRNDLQTQRICHHIAMVEQAVAWQKAHGIDRTCEHYGVVIIDDKNNPSGYKDAESQEWIKNAQTNWWIWQRMMSRLVA